MTAAGSHIRNARRGIVEVAHSTHQPLHFQELSRHFPSQTTRDEGPRTFRVKLSAHSLLGSYLALPTRSHAPALVETAAWRPLATVGPSLAATGLATLVAATVLASACGSSSQTESVTAPSPAKCTLQGTAE